MRKITKDSVYAFTSGLLFKRDNTEVCFMDECVVLKLFGNPIAARHKRDVAISSAGWETATTKERLNGIPGVHIVSRKGRWYLNGTLWKDSRSWKLVTTSDGDYERVNKSFRPLLNI